MEDEEEDVIPFEAWFIVVSEHPIKLVHGMCCKCDRCEESF